MSWEESFLNWFADQKIPVRELHPRIGGLEYYLFSTDFHLASGRRLTAFGSSSDRKLAAIKCAAESAERRFMAEVFDGPDTALMAKRIRFTATQVEEMESVTVPLPPRRIRSSNGWAVHFSEGGAVQAACREALERHLLLKSFYKWGWAGFRLVQEMSTDEIQLYFMTSRLTLDGSYLAGIVAAISPLYPGVSFGYCLGDSARVTESGFWEPALFESVGKILSLGGQAIQVPEGPNSWLFSAVKDYLESPFDTHQLKAGREFSTVPEAARTGCLKVFDLNERWKLDFPLYAAFCWGGDFVPLTDASLLDEGGQSYFLRILQENGIQNPVPTRHPIL